jgi:hypothetical protein
MKQKKKILCSVGPARRLPGFGDTSTCAAGSARRGGRWWAIAIHVDVAIESSDQLVAPGSARVHVTERGCRSLPIGFWRLAPGRCYVFASSARLPVPLPPSHSFHTRSLSSQRIGSFPFLSYMAINVERHAPRTHLVPFQFLPPSRPPLARPRVLTCCPPPLALFCPPIGGAHTPGGASPGPGFIYGLLQAPPLDACNSEPLYFCFSSVL